MRVTTTMKQDVSSASRPLRRATVLVIALPGWGFNQVAISSRSLRLRADQATFRSTFGASSCALGAAAA